MPRTKPAKDATAAARQRRHRERFAVELQQLKAAAAAASKPAAEPVQGPDITTATSPGTSPIVHLEHLQRWPERVAGYIAPRLGRHATMVLVRALTMEAGKLPHDVPQPAR
ncbi:hypothetical protein QIH96_05325 [Bradyrhizobium japonicum]|uniref:hypothetical protein n=1 Tax=Bradyrhizobium japonicum TaxID=375 RepID=UPI002714D6E3|nr:hypothetical protein [Bradyrhizobium japonicum]WLB64667.1 hypothetical protein QIH96_05325 [Bradyrhizobium japonicum]